MKPLQLFAFLNSIFLGIPTLCWSLPENSTEMFLNNLLPQEYGSAHPPIRISADKTVLPAVVYFRLRPEHVTDISMKNMDFSCDLTLRLEWHDHRLNMENVEKYIDSSTELPPQIFNELWYPEVTFDNCKGDRGKVATPSLIQIGPLMTKGASAAGKIGLRTYCRKTFHFTCHLKFAAYPFDVQQCEIKFRSKTKIEPFEPTNIILNIGRTYNEVPVPPGFRLTELSFKHRFNSSRIKSGEKYTTIHSSLVFTMQRVFAQHIMLIFLPSILIVILSWLSFWLEPDFPAPRVALGLTTLLTLSTQFNTAQKDLPPVADVKALDVWMVACMFMVFSSLLEFGIANWLSKKKPSKVQPVKLAPPHVYYFERLGQPNLQENGLDQKNNALRLQNRRTWNVRGGISKRRISTCHIDQIARIAFPVVFLVFNIAFWTYYIPRK